MTLATMLNDTKEYQRAYGEAWAAGELVELLIAAGELRAATIARGYFTDKANRVEAIHARQQRSMGTEPKASPATREATHVN